MTDCLIIQNIIAPYKTLLFNALFRSTSKNFKVIYLSETMKLREWIIEKNEIRFPFTVLHKGKLDDANQLTLAIKTYRQLNHYNPKVIIIGGYSYLAFWAALIWTKKNRKKAILINESHYLDRPRTFIREFIKKIFVSNCNAALVDGTRHKDYTIKLGLKPESIFIKMGTGPVDIELYQTKASEHERTKKSTCKNLGIPKNNFIFVGRFSPEKNIRFLLSAYKKFKDTGIKEWGLILLGNGPQKHEIELFIRQNDIQDVLLPGFRQKNEVPFYYSISDVLILPSISEPWGLVVSEAMASSLPVFVSRNCGCYPDIVHCGINGFVFDPYNVEELYSLMQNVANGTCDLKKMGKASLEIIRDYSPEKVSEAYLKAINAVDSEVDAI